MSTYAFAEIESINCTGDVDQFSATLERDKFLVKVRALNGELPEVKKLKPSSGPVRDSPYIAIPKTSER